MGKPCFDVEGEMEVTIIVHSKQETHVSVEEEMEMTDLVVMYVSTWYIINETMFNTERKMKVTNCE